MNSLCMKVLAATMAILLTACGEGHTVVNSTPVPGIKAQTASIGYEEGTVKPPEATVAKMKQFLEQRFFQGKAPKFTPGSELVIKWGFIGHDAGSQFTRWFIGFGAGSAKTVVRAEFFDAAGNKVGSIQADGSVSGGFFGGSGDEALKQVAEQIAKYAEANFR